jgi:hypothetical protein
MYDHSHNISSLGEDCGRKLTKIRSCINTISKEKTANTIESLQRTNKRLEDVLRFIEIEVELAKSREEISQIMGKN